MLGIHQYFLNLYTPFQIETRFDDQDSTVAKIIMFSFIIVTIGSVLYYLQRRKNNITRHKRVQITWMNRHTNNVQFN
jgi:hypothetical protein